MVMVKLYGNTICPYSQRTEIAFKECNIYYEFVTVDFLDKPLWLATLSPLNKLPILEASNIVIYGSSPIVEFANEISGGTLLASDPISRARQRSLCQYVDHLHDCARDYFTSMDQESMTVTGKLLQNEIEKFFNQPLPSDYSSNGIDILGIYLIPLFILLDTLDFMMPLSLFKNQKAVHYKKTLLKRDSAKSINTDFLRSSLIHFINQRNNQYFSNGKAEAL